MLRHLVAVSLCLAAGSAIAQGVNAVSESTTTSSSNAANSGNNQSLIVNSDSGAVGYSGSYTVRNTGAAVLPGFAGSFSSDYCGGTVGGAAGGIGFALSFGAPKIDPACVMLRTYERTMQAAATERDAFRRENLRLAALELLTHIDPAVKEVFNRHGVINPQTPIRLENQE